MTLNGRPENFADLWSADRAVQNSAYVDLLAEAESPVEWAYLVWDETVAMLGHPTTTTGR